MPELPEVESVRQSLLPKILHKSIVNIQVTKKEIIRNDFNFFVTELQGNEFVDIQRRGKLLFLQLPDESALAVHLKMTGKLLFEDTSGLYGGGHSLSRHSLDPKHTHVVFTFADSTQLVFHDVRRFGFMRIINAQEKEKILLQYGVEPLAENFTLENFKKAIQRNTTIKSVLLNQKYIAGIGNIYADEICYAAGVYPAKNAKQLSEKEIKKLFQVTEEIIGKAVKLRGTTFQDYRDGLGRKGGYLPHLSVYKRTGKPCRQCGSLIQKIRVGGRGTHICPTCQPGVDGGRGI